MQLLHNYETHPSMKDWKTHVNQHVGFSEGKMTPINICGKIPLSCWLTNTK